ncbi:hypothetical protein ABIB50_003749 [Mucilaginibacter sp. UYCu711]
MGRHSKSWVVNKIFLIIIKRIKAVEIIGLMHLNPTLPNRINKFVIN